MLKICVFSLSLDANSEPQIRLTKWEKHAESMRYVNMNRLTLVMMVTMSPSLIDSSSSFCASYGKRTLHCSRPADQMQHKVSQWNYTAEKREHRTLQTELQCAQCGFACERFFFFFFTVILRLLTFGFAVRFSLHGFRHNACYFPFVGLKWRTDRRKPLFLVTCIHSHL